MSPLRSPALRRMSLVRAASFAGKLAALFAFVLLAGAIVGGGRL